MRAVALAFCFTSQEGLLDAQGLTGTFGGGLRPAAGRTDQDKWQKYTEINIQMAFNLKWVEYYG